jgi:hypothetical protein
VFVPGNATPTSIQAGTVGDGGVSQIDGHNRPGFSKVVLMLNTTGRF